jgi:lantibiotic biosynthesis protein
MAEWRPLLVGELAARARDVVEQIADRLENSVSTSAGLADAAGRALLFDRIGRSDAADQQLEHSLGRPDLAGPGLFSGLAGLAFVLAQLGGEVDEEIDAALAARLREDDPHDLIFGVSGIGVYALERMPDTAPLLNRVIQWLDARAVRSTIGRYLFTAPDLLSPLLRERHPAGAIDLGVAHGQGGAIVVAAGAAKWSVPRAHELYDDLVAYLWSQASVDEPCFKMTVGSAASRAAWCYGDPGLAAALYSAASTIGDEESRRRALKLALSAGRRSSWLEVKEPNLCHGVVGLAHIFNRLAQATGDDELARVALAGYQLAITQALPEQLDLLEGQLGIALSLTASFNDEAPDWDRALAMSTRVASAD